MEKILNITGKALFSIPFLAFGVRHFMHASAMAGMVPLPGGIFWIYITGAAQLLFVISMWSGKYVKLSGILLALMLLIFALSIHLPGSLKPETVMYSIVSLYKDLGLAGGALILAAYYTSKKEKEAV
jgi:uncharacterized membrane protein